MREFKIIFSMKHNYRINQLKVTSDFHTNRKIGEPTFNSAEVSTTYRKRFKDKRTFGNFSASVHDVDLMLSHNKGFVGAG